MKSISKEFLITVIKESIDCSTTHEDNEKIFFEHPDGDKEISLENKQLDEIVTLINKTEDTGEIGIYTNNYYEIHINEINRSIIARGNEIDTSMTDDDNSIHYAVGKPSIFYISYCLLELKEKLENEFIGIIRDFPFSLSGINEGVQEYSFQSYFSNCLPRLKTVIIQTTNNTKYSRMYELFQSFLFHLSYNLKLVLVPYTTIDEIVGRKTKKIVARSKREELDSPKRLYDGELINYYQQGLGADVAYLKYISFYHVIEHFFDSIFVDDLIEKVKNKITLPNFSYKRKKDLKGLVDMIGKNYKVREDEEASFDERTALKLVLKKYIKIEDLKNTLDEIDTSLVPYYEQSTVSFSKGNIVIFNEKDEGNFYKSLEERIYKTRCSLVHSKSSSTDKYVPFADDKILNKEIPLLQSISEMLILQTSKLI